MKLLNALAVLLTAAVIISACKKEEEPVPEETLTIPEITSLTATQDTIAYGGDESTVITCSATGGGLDYEWQVDLGQLVPVNTEKSEVQFTASDCCLGDKKIYCTVSNDKGSRTDSIMIFIKM